MTFRLFQSNLTELKQFFLFSTSQILTASRSPATVDPLFCRLIILCVFSFHTTYIYFMSQDSSDTLHTSSHGCVFLTPKHKCGSNMFEKRRIWWIEKEKYHHHRFAFLCHSQLQIFTIKATKYNFFYLQSVIIWQPGGWDSTITSLSPEDALIFLISPLYFLSVKCFSCEWVVWICNVWLENVLLCKVLLIIYT